MREIRVFILDDEKAIRETLKRTIDWKGYGMVVAGEACSGSEAINTIDTLLPDLLIVDIRMPFMNGVEFSQIISKRYPEIKIIILTAHADFEYAKECIEIKNVICYLLKPIDSSEINNHLKAYKDNININAFNKESVIPIALEDEGSVEVIEQINAYICENYHNTYLNVGALAEHFGYNPGYLGALYKKKTGTLLSDKIFAERMKAAIILKKKNYKMYIVARKVGIEDAFYFSKCFRKYTGKSFSEFNNYEEG